MSADAEKRVQTRAREIFERTRSASLYWGVGDGGGHFAAASYASATDVNNPTGMLGSDERQQYIEKARKELSDEGLLDSR